jgi:hypothetical protein
MGIRPRINEKSVYGTGGERRPKKEEICPRMNPPEEGLASD